MFGLMRAGTCAGTSEERRERRLLYCGTCKAMGRMFGQRTRLLLDHDAVFLGELLALLSGEQRVLDSWNEALHAYSCLAIPPEGEIPRSLQVAAAAGVLMAEFKVADQIEDSAAPGWRWAQAVLASGFQEASSRLRGWSFPLESLRQLAKAQSVLEGSPAEGSPAERLRALAGPTADATGLLFMHAARTVGRSDQEASMRALGSSFGALVYVLDALEDHPRDMKHGDFNAFADSLGISSPKLEGEQAAWAADRVWEAAGGVADALEVLSLPARHRTRFRQRMESNIATRLEKLGLPAGLADRRYRGHDGACSRARTPGSWSERFDRARELADRMAAHHREVSVSGWRDLEGHLVFVTSLTMAFLFPDHAASARSYRECMEGALNLIVLGSLFAVPGRRHPAVVAGPHVELLVREDRGAQIRAGPGGSGAPGGHEDEDQDSWRSRYRRRRREREERRSGQTESGCCGSCHCCNCCECGEVCTCFVDGCGSAECGTACRGCSCGHACEGCGSCGGSGECCAGCHGCGDCCSGCTGCGECCTGAECCGACSC